MVRDLRKVAWCLEMKIWQGVGKVEHAFTHRRRIRADRQGLEQPGLAVKKIKSRHVTTNFVTSLRSTQKLTHTHRKQIRSR